MSAHTSLGPSPRTLSMQFVHRSLQMRVHQERTMENQWQWLGNLTRPQFVA